MLSKNAANIIEIYELNVKPQKNIKSFIIYFATLLNISTFATDL